MNWMDDGSCQHQTRSDCECSIEIQPIHEKDTGGDGILRCAQYIFIECLVQLWIRLILQDFIQQLLR